MRQEVWLGVILGCAFSLAIIAVVMMNVNEAGAEKRRRVHMLRILLWLSLLYALYRVF